MNSLELFANGQQVSTLRLEATIGRTHLSRVHADARFFGNEQFRLKPVPEGWIISPVPGTVNPTLVNNAPLIGSQPVSNGMTVTVRGADGLNLELRVISEATPAPAPPPAAHVPAWVAPAPRPRVIPTGDLAEAISGLQDLLTRIEINSLQSQQHRTNATLANTGAALTYLLTSGSKRKTVRTVGQVVALGGVLYGSSQSNHASNLDAQNNLLIDSGLSVIELQGLPQLRLESNPDAVRRFLELVPRLGVQVDVVIKSQGNRLKNKSLLGKTNQQLLLNALHIDIVNNKLRLNQIVSQIDRTKTFPDVSGTFTSQISTIVATKLRMEGIYTRIIIGVLVVLGIALANINPSGTWIFLAGIGFWGINHFFPFFPQSRKLRNAINSLVEALQNQSTVQNLIVT